MPARFTALSAKRWRMRTMHDISSSAAGTASADAWNDWRRGVVCAIGDYFEGIFEHVTEEDIDWDAWRPLYDEGRSPRAAVARAFLRDL